MNKQYNVDVTISSDEYKAYVTIKPDPNVPLSLTDLGPLLKDRGVVFGIKKDVLMIIVDRYLKGSFIDNILVAEGIPPFAGVEPAVEYKFEISTRPKEDESGRVDYREISTIPNVEKGQLLAIKRKLKPPVNGITVTGKRTTFPQFNDVEVKTGENIEKEDREDFIYYTAAADGALRIENKVMSIFPTLKIAEDVDFNVGNIHFKGDVRIGRDVLPDFVVEVDGKLTIWGSAIACKLNAKEGIEVRAGIVGKNKGEVYSGEDITATFVENSKLKAKTDIIVKNGIIGGEVACDGELKLQMPRSRVVGSTVRAARGITVYNAGSRFDASTRLITGIDPAKEKEYLQIKENLDTKMKEAKTLEAKHGRPVLEKKAFSPVFSQKTKDDIAKWEVLKKDIQLVFQRLKKAESEMYDYNAVIRVKENLYPRVSLNIGSHQMTTVKDYYNVTVRFSEEENRFIIQ